jgi:hypothetical protein
LFLLGIFERNPITAILSATSIVTSACYSLFLYNRLSYGSYSIHLSILKDINRREFFLLLSLLIPTIFLGIFPNVILDTLHLSVTSLLYEISSSTPSEILESNILLIIVNNSKLRINLPKFNYSYRNMNQSSESSDSEDNDNSREVAITLDETQRQALLNGLEEVAKTFEPKTSSEYCKGYISTFEEAFPELNFNPDHNILKSFSESSRADIKFESVDNPYDQNNIKEILSHITDNSGKELKKFSEIYDFLNKNHSIENLFKQPNSVLISKDNFKYVKFDENNMIINLENTKELTGKFLNVAKEHKELELITDTVSLVPFLITYFIYKRLVSTYERATSVDYKKIKAIPNEISIYSAQHAKSIMVYRLHAIFTAFCLSSIATVSLNPQFKDLMNNVFSSDPVETKTSMMLLILSKFNKKFKEHKIFKFFILFILCFLVILNLPYLKSYSIII